MRKIILLAVALVLVSCQAYQDDGVRPIRSQRDIDAYNASVSSEDQKLVCSREKVVGTNFREYVCLTVAQKEAQLNSTREVLDILNN